MSGVYTKSNGVFKISQMNSKFLNSWKDTFQVYLKMGNTWRKTYNYYYTYSGWSNCSKTCGGGTQTRTSTCNRSDGIVKSDSYCKRYGLTKAALSQSCNTHSCFPANPANPVYKGLYYTGNKFKWVDLGAYYSKYMAPEAGTYRVYMKAHLVYAGHKSCVTCTSCDGSSSRHPGQFVVFIDGKTNRSLCNSRCCTDYGYWGNCYLGKNGLGVNSNTVQTSSTNSVLNLVLGEVYLNANETFNLRYWGRIHTDQDEISIEYDGPNFYVWADRIG